MKNQTENKQAEPAQGLTLRSLSGYSASKQIRAKKIQILTEMVPELRAAYLSRNNEDFRKACIRIARAAEDENKAYAFLSLLPIENHSAAIQFAADAFVEVERAKGKQEQVINLSKDEFLAALKL